MVDVLSFSSYFVVHIFVDFFVFPHSLGVNVEDLEASLFIGKANFHLHLQPTGPHQGLVNHVLPVGHSNDKNVVQLLHT